MPTDKNFSGVELKLFWQTDRLTPVVHEKLGFALHGLSPLRWHIQKYMPSKALLQSHERSGPNHPSIKEVQVMRRPP
jgi:hypothetical protein